MKNKNVHVLRKNDRWAVKVEDNQRASRYFDTQREAADYARLRAIQNQSELLIHNLQNRIREKNSYGKDRFPPKG